MVGQAARVVGRYGRVELLDCRLGLENKTLYGVEAKFGSRLARESHLKPCRNQNLSGTFVEFGRMVGLRVLIKSL